MKKILYYIFLVVGAVIWSGLSLFSIGLISLAEGNIGFEFNIINYSIYLLALPYLIAHFLIAFLLKGTIFADIMFVIILNLILHLLFIILIIKALKKLAAKIRSK